MKIGILTLALAMTCASVYAQDDSAKATKVDTVRIGNMIIIKKAGQQEGRTVTMSRKTTNKDANISTSWFILDLGFANWDDQTNYTQATSSQYIINRPGSPNIAENDLKLRTGKSSNVNLWFFMQRLNVIKHFVNLKYGLGLEMQNYRFKSPISFKEGGNIPYSPTQQALNHPFIFRDSILFSKNKLAADYVTVPFMINFVTNPDHPEKGISLSAGISAGYLYSTRNKQISDERGKRKNRGDYDLEKWKVSYIAELGLGPARLYGSYSPKSVFKTGLKMLPYNVGVRLSNW
jgi:hypothetical protein